MKPHQQEPTPPGREDGSPEGNEEQSGEIVARGDLDYAPEETVACDSGVSSVDANQAYGEAAYDYADPNQVYADPNQVYADPNQVYADPNQVYADPNQVYADPNQAYADPNAFYDETQQAYVDPGQPYAETDHGYAADGIYDESPDHSYPAPLPPPPVVKKIVTSRAPQRRPLAPSRKVPGSGYKRPRPAYNSGGGLSFLTVFLTLVAMGMLAAVFFVVQPRDMSSVAGYPVNPLAATGKPRNLLEETQKLMISRSADLSLSEEEVNLYLNQRLQAEQTGPMAAIVKFRGLYIDFTPGFADVIIERELFGMPLTMSATISTEKFRQQTVYRATNWHLGRIDLGEVTIKPVSDLFLRLRMSCLDEFQTLQQMVEVKFVENKVILDSRL
ncbi:MAG: hypothetical protein NWR99_08545 [Verrucomicrobiales bacterium]|jgi:hypothetical protein|nr:hypothetical protein [Verrucomicrobiales bacterium]